MTRPYAKTTKVSIARSRAEIEQTLKRATAMRIVTMDEPDHALVMFVLGARLIRFRVPIAAKATDQERRSRWRALGLVIRAKIESVATGITTIDDEWFSFVVLPDGRTVSEWAGPPVQAAIDSGRMPSTPLMIQGPK